MPHIIEGVKQKELFCKNDDCMKFLGYAKIKSGVVTLWCRGCEQWNTWKINYGKGQENIDMLVDEFQQEGGE